MPKRIERLTPEQIARFPEFIEKWTRIGLCTDPADRPNAEAGIKLAYKAAGLDPPKSIVWCGSPMSQGLTRAIVFGLKEAEIKIGDSVWDSLGASVWDSVGASVGASVRASVRASVGDSGYGQQDANWLAFYDYFKQVCSLDEITQRLAGMWLLSQSAGWWLPHKNMFWVSERHNLLNRNTSGQLHCDDGPALAYPDGWRIWAINGLRVDQQIVMSPHTQTIPQIDGEQNNDVRSIRINRFGWPRYLSESGSDCRDERANDIEGTMEALYRTKAGDQRLVVTCPTGRLFALGVPSDVATCEQAQHWLAGGKNFRVLART